MREILFRGKRTDNHKWIEGTGVFNDSVHTWIFANEPNRAIACGMQHYIVNPKTVGQYTGLTDKNGKKVGHRKCNVVSLGTRSLCAEFVQHL